MKRTTYLLRTRLNDNDPWSKPEEFPTRRERDKAARVARVIGGIRTHSYEEKIKPTEDDR